LGKLPRADSCRDAALPRLYENVAFFSAGMDLILSQSRKIIQIKKITVQTNDGAFLEH
jgi:hypothetical protein